MLDRPNPLRDGPRSLMMNAELPELDQNGNILLVQASGIYRLLLFVCEMAW